MLRQYPFGSLRTDPHWSVQGLVLYPNFRPAGTRLIDESFNSLHGTLVHDPPWVGNALDFDGVNDYVSIASDPRLENFTALTLGAWINPQGQPGASWGRIISKDQGGTSDDYAISHVDTAGGRDNEIACRINTDTGTTTLESNTGVLPNTGWHFVVGTWDGANVRVYLNGLLDGEAARTGTLDDSNLPLGIGGHQASNTRRFNGLMRGAFIYSRDLSANEILELAINPGLPMQQLLVPLFRAPAVVGANPKGPLGHPLYGPFAGPIVC